MGSTLLAIALALATANSAQSSDLNPEAQIETCFTLTCDSETYETTDKATAVQSARGLGVWASSHYRARSQTLISLRSSSLTVTRPASVHRTRFLL